MLAGIKIESLSAGLRFSFQSAAFDHLPLLFVATILFGEAKSEVKETIRIDKSKVVFIGYDLNADLKTTVVPNPGMPEF